MKLIYSERAYQELENAITWDGAVSNDIAILFLDKLPINKFPFTIYYTVSDNKIIIQAIFDSRQDPNKRPQ